MEKKKLHYSLELVKRLIADKGRDPFTQSAKNGAAEMGLDADELRGVVAGLMARDFYKSMTTHTSSMVWQDVYRPVTRLGAAYVKVTVYPQENLIVVSFKGL
jgi:motility quorum-sensing regulator/GCU-specific mRNA interferase toxin